MVDIVTMGEVMIQFNPLTTGPLRHVTLFEKHVAGSEGNFAIGMARMGFESGFITRLGSDEFGRCILSALKGEGVDTSRITLDVDAPTGLYFIQRSYPIPGKSSVQYYRSGSAASKISVNDVDPEYIKQARLLHLTGITPALSDSCHNACLKALEIASQEKVTVSFDTNIRLRLWSGERARSIVVPMLKKANIVLTEPEDAEVLFGEKEPERIIKILHSLGVETAVVKLAEEGAVASKSGEIVKKTAYKVTVTDTVGAGDAFAAGFISSLLRKCDLGEAIEVANASGALVVTVRGDFENLPTLDDVRKFLASQRKETVVLR